LVDTAFKESHRIYRTREKHQPPSRYFLQHDIYQNPLFEELEDEISKIEIDGGISAGGRGDPPPNNSPSLNNDPPNNNPPHNDSAICTRLFKYFTTPQIDDMHSSMDVSVVDLNNFELKPTLIIMIQQN
jgi:hypothetical protein